ncbi:MAG TPA: hypothetical protein VK438_05435 [Xanthobacteraceae bacterium]|nr:hypothetical protein [Xanthobacteraceae bacterium]
MSAKASLSLAGFVALIVVLATTFSFGRQARVRMEQAETAAHEQEASALCRDVGLSPESAAFTRCLSGLRELRLHDRSRWEADAVGLL